MHLRILSILTHADNPPDIAMITKDKIFDIINIENIQALVLKWSNLMGEDIM